MKYFNKLRLFTILEILVLFNSCNVNDTSPYKNVLFDFKLYNINDSEETIFRSGENFKMEFSIINFSKKDLTIYCKLPAVRFKIQHEDSTVSTSEDGLVYIGESITIILHAGEKINYFWLAPNSPAQSQKISLTAGKYKALAQPKLTIDDYFLNEISTREFTVVDE